MTDHQRLVDILAERGRNYSVDITPEGSTVWDFGKMNKLPGRPVYWRFDVPGKLVYVSSKMRAWWRLRGQNITDPNA
jgi:hypothetical protein